MARRPGNINIQDANKAPTSSNTSPLNRFHLDLPSPRVGEVPPALSPLDAFAQQSRLLARKFEESQQKGRRISRLDHSEIASQFGRKTSYFRSASGHTENGRDRHEDRDALPSPITMTPDSERPKSYYPRFGVAANEESKRSTMTPDNFHDAPEDVQVPDSYFGIAFPRASSPEQLGPRANKPDDAPPAIPSLTGSVDSMTSSTPRTNTDESITGQRTRRGLAPPRSPHHPRSGRSISIRSVIDSADEDSTSLDLAPPRKFSSSSGYSRPRSPLTPDYPPCHSPSMRSDRSADGQQYQRPSFNFSRPLSSASNKNYLEGRPSLGSQPSFERRPSLDLPPRQSSIDPTKSPLRQASITSHDPTILHSDLQTNQEPSSGEDSISKAAKGAPSYIYSKYSLPRGRTVERGSVGLRDSWMQHQVSYEDAPKDNAYSPVLQQLSSSFQEQQEVDAARSVSLDDHVPSTPQSSISHKTNPSTPSIISHSTDRTIRQHTRNSPSSDIVNMSPEEHLEKGIECHSSGSLSKSTYHLRLAARAGLPTAMLLYALACRHGWGMRPNQQEGVQWLKKAVESSSLEVMSNDTVFSSTSQPTPGLDQKSKAQYALAVYELGMSYMNGWGIIKDKALALRCFEIAGNWGDCDALAEAGFCYTQGVGCKKNLKKAASLYRKAADGGMSMAGNSW